MSHELRIPKAMAWEGGQQIPLFATFLSRVTGYDYTRFLRSPIVTGFDIVFDLDPASDRWNIGQDLAPADLFVSLPDFLSGRSTRLADALKLAQAHLAAPGPRAKRQRQQLDSDSDGDELDSDDDLGPLDPRVYHKDEELEELLCCFCLQPDPELGGLPHLVCDMLGEGGVPMLPGTGCTGGCHVACMIEGGMGAEEAAALDDPSRMFFCPKCLPALREAFATLSGTRAWDSFSIAREAERKGFPGDPMGYLESQRGEASSL